MRGKKEWWLARSKVRVDVLYRVDDLADELVCYAGDEPFCVGKRSLQGRQRQPALLRVYTRYQLRESGSATTFTATNGGAYRGDGWQDDRVEHCRFVLRLPALVVRKVFLVVFVARFPSCRRA